MLELDIIALLHFGGKCHLCIWKARMKLIAFCLIVCHGLPVINPEMLVIRAYLYFGKEFIFVQNLSFVYITGIFLSLQFLKNYINLLCLSEHFVVNIFFSDFLSLIFFMKCVGTSDSSAEHFTLKMDGNPTKRDEGESFSLDGFTLIVWNFRSQ